jgi:D-methionine transport system permease protein
MWQRFNLVASTELNGGLFEQYMQWDQISWDAVWENTLDTLYMTFFSILFVIVLGVILGLLLYKTNGSTHPLAKITYKVTSGFVNVCRSIPFLILIVFLIPVTISLMDTMIGPKAALPALIVSAAPFYARLVETAFRDIDKGVVEAAEAMGASRFEIIYKVLIPESLPAIIAGITVTAISLINFSATAGVIGAGGLGNMAYLGGYQRNRHTVTLIATVVIVLIVFIIQAIGDYAVKKIDKR